MSSLYIITAAGFLILTLIFAFLLISLIQKGIDQTPWPEERNSFDLTKNLFLCGPQS